MSDDRCDCYLPTKPPEGVDRWLPEIDPEPAPPVFAVVRLGEDPALRRAVRVAGGWAEYGSLVNFYGAITPPMLWERVGLCWAGTSHPVVAVHEERDGTWVETRIRHLR